MKIKKFNQLKLNENNDSKLMEFTRKSIDEYQEKWKDGENYNRSMIFWKREGIFMEISKILKYIQKIDGDKEEIYNYIKEGITTFLNLSVENYKNKQ